MADDKTMISRNDRLMGKTADSGVTSRRDYYMAHLAAAELARHPPDHALYLPEIADRASQLATLLMKKADENG